MAKSDDLLNYIFKDIKKTLYADFETWLRGSRRFQTFADVHRNKIRAKLRNIRTDESMLDLRIELQTAAVLLTEKAFELDYEKYAAARQRGPDFTVTFKTHTPFNVEVRRVRHSEFAESDPTARNAKLMTVLCEKVRQMPPKMVNFVWMVVEYEISEEDLVTALKSLQQMAERKEEEFFIRYGFNSAVHYLKQFQQLSGIILRQSGQNNVVWLNPAARHKAPPDLVRTIQRLD